MGFIDLINTKPALDGKLCVLYYVLLTLCESDLSY